MSTGTLTRAGRTSGLRDPKVSIDPRLSARRAEVARSRGRRRLRRLVALVVLAVLAAAAFAVTRSPLLDVDQITVDQIAVDQIAVDTVDTSLEAGPSAEVVEASGLVAGDPMVAIDPGAVAARVESLPWVADASVHRNWPGSIRIAVTVRQPVAVIGPPGRESLVDGSGAVLGPVRGASDARLVSLGRGQPPEPGQVVGAPLRAAVGVIAELPHSVVDEIASARSGDKGVEFVLTDGIRVTVGDGSRLSAKASTLRALLDEAARETIATIDLRLPGTASLTRRPGSGA